MFSRVNESRAEVNTTGQDLVPTAEERSNYGKTVKQSIRSMWGLEYEIEDIQECRSEIEYINLVRFRWHIS